MTTTTDLVGTSNRPAAETSFEARLRTLRDALADVDDDFWNWLRGLDQRAEPDRRSLVKAVRAYHFNTKLHSSNGLLDDSADGDFWEWLTTEIWQQAVTPASLPTAIRDGYYRYRLTRLLESGQDLSAPPCRLFSSIEDDFWFWMNTDGYAQSPELRQILPGLPNADVAAGFVGSAGNEALREGYEAYLIFKQAYEANVGPIAGCTGVLDCGVGWGRILRFFLKDVEPSRLWGIDPDANAIDLCRSTNRRCNFEVSNPFPPTSFPDGSFDLIFLFSVFSHLSEPAHQTWLTEFHRLLRPGGLLIATTWHRGFITWCAELRRDPTLECESVWREALTNVFMDTEQTLADYDAGKFCFADFDPARFPVPVFEGMPSYGEACIPREYVLERWTDRFRLIDFIDDRSRCAQNVIIVQKDWQTATA